MATCAIQKLTWYERTEDATVSSMRFRYERAHAIHGKYHRRATRYMQVLQHRRDLERMRQYAVSFVRSSAEEQRFRDRFEQLACRWHRETRMMSSTVDIVTNHAYQDILGMGAPVVRYILRDLQTRGGQWFWALKHITNENPVPQEDAGKIHKMTEAWLRWGREHRYL